MNEGIHSVALSKKFPNGVTALINVSITIGQGEFVALIGRSGSGKSTLMNILGGLDHPTTGSVTINGKEVDYRNRTNLIDIRRTQVGFIFQQFNLIPSLSAMENVAYPLLFNYSPKEERTERAIRLLTMVGLGERADHLPHQLSGGE